jgi:hypothetical protein
MRRCQEKVAVRRAAKRGSSQGEALIPRRARTLSQCIRRDHMIYRGFILLLALIVTIGLAYSRRRKCWDDTIRNHWTNWRSGNLSSMDETRSAFTQKYGHFAPELRCRTLGEVRAPPFGRDQSAEFRLVGQGPRGRHRGMVRQRPKVGDSSLIFNTPRPCGAVIELAA